MPAQLGHACFTRLTASVVASSDAAMANFLVRTWQCLTLKRYRCSKVRVEVVYAIKPQHVLHFFTKYD